VTTAISKPIKLVCTLDLIAEKNNCAISEREVSTMSKGLQYALYLTDKNIKLPADKLIEILKPYESELAKLGGFGYVQMPTL
jgi:hypothetical protein